jgi:hypothetical protein
MGETRSRVSVQLAWTDTRELRVEQRDDGLFATAHPGLSEAQVRAACEHLGDAGPQVYAQWRGVVGL